MGPDEPVKRISLMNLITGRTNDGSLQQQMKQDMKQYICYEWDQSYFRFLLPTVKPKRSVRVNCESDKVGWKPISWMTPRIIPQTTNQQDMHWSRNIFPKIFFHFDFSTVSGRCDVYNERPVQLGFLSLFYIYDLDCLRYFIHSATHVTLDMKWLEIKYRPS